MHGIIHLLDSYKANHNRHDLAFLWGDEIEYMLVHFDDAKAIATLDLEHDGLLEYFAEGGAAFKLICQPRNISFHPEYGRFMIEATPLRPYDGDSIDDFLSVEGNMKARRDTISELIEELDVVPITITSFPLMGVDGFTHKHYPAKGEASHSLFLPDEIINRHVRFPTLTQNIRLRRGDKVAINVPIYPDKHTQPLDKIDVNIPHRNLFAEDSDAFLGAAKPGHIYMDSMGFGMGCSCLQVTMQASNIDECRYLYDTLLPLTPILLALSAAAPIFKGTLADQDVRWNVIASAVDDRTPIERGTPALKGHLATGGTNPDRKLKPIRKSRYESIDMYLGDYDSETKTFGKFKPEYNDLDVEINDKAYKQLKDGSLDDLLAEHFAHLFIRDSLVLFLEIVGSESRENDEDHFQNIQSTNWQTLRFKPAEKQNGPGWRVEFRSMEIQLTDFENAAYSVFIILVAKSILKYKPNYYIPVSLIDSNMKTAHKRDGVAEKYWFRNTKEGQANGTANGVANGVADWKQFSADEIINGKILPQVRKYVKEELGENDRINAYLELISKRASGEITTTAKFIRNFVTKHPEYKQDSIINKTINYDLLKKLEKVGNLEKKSLAEFFGAFAHSVEIN